MSTFPESIVFTLNYSLFYYSLFYYSPKLPSCHELREWIGGVARRAGVVPSHPTQLHRRRLIGIPLAHIDAFILINTNIMTMLEHLGFMLQGGLQDAVFVNGCIATRTGQHFIVCIQNRQKSAAILLLAFGVLRPANAGKQMLPVYHRPANIHARGIDALDELAVQSENLEAALLAGSANQYGIVRVSVVYYHTVCTIEIMFLVFIVPASKLTDKPAAAVELQNIIGSVSVSHINVAIGRHTGFGWEIAVLILVSTNGMGLGQGEDDTAFDIGLDHIAVLGFRFPGKVFVKSIVYNQQKILITFLADGESVPGRKGMPPGVQQLPRLIKHQDIVMGVIAHHDQAALAVLHHFMAVDYRMGARTDFGPTLVYCIRKPIMTDDCFCGLKVVVADGKSKALAGKQSC